VADKDFMKQFTPREKAERRHGSLVKERSSYIDHWKQISNYILPRNGRFFTQDRNRGERKHNNIYDSTGTKALRVLGAGLMSGATSPARPWFRMAMTNKDLMKYQPVKLWLNYVTAAMLDVFSRSNTYRMLHGMYEELGAFGTSASVVMDDFEKVIHHYPLTIGEFCLATDYKGVVNCMTREFDKTVSEVVGEFGYKNCSITTQRMYDEGNYDNAITLIHIVEPRMERDTRSPLARDMPYKSCYFEKGCSDPSKEYLRESGMREFRVLAPRWQVMSGDIYGSSPGMETLGDIKQLQHQQLRKAEAIDFKTKPPIGLPASMKNREIDRLPGGVSFIDETAGVKGIKNLFEVNLDLNHLLADIQDVRRRIDEGFYKDLFLMLANQTNTRMTATEVAERHEEKLLMLGPVLERLHNELFERLIQVTFTTMLRSGLIPPPPPEMQGQELNVEFISMLAQAQRAVSTNSIDRFVVSLGTLASIKPGVLDKLSEDDWADEYAEALGINPELIVPDEQVALIRKQRADQQAAMQQAATMQAGAETAAKLASAPTDQKNVLTDITRAFQGYT
jgi:hypothetical protein